MIYLGDSSILMRLVTWRGCLCEGVLQGHHGLAGAPGHHHAVTRCGVYRVKRLEQPLRSVAPLVHQEVPHKVVLIHIIHIAENNNIVEVVYPLFTERPV